MGKEQKPPPPSNLPFIFGAILLAGLAVAYHFRQHVAMSVLPRVLEPTTGKTLGIEFQMFQYANWLESVGVADDVARCCYTPDFVALHSQFCDPDTRQFGFTQDTIPLLKSCSSHLRGRMEYPLTDFRQDGYQGKVRATGKLQSTYLISDLSRKKKANTSQLEPIPEVACKLIKKCSEKANKSDKVCRQMRQMVGECHSN